MSLPCPHPIKVYSDRVLMSYPPKKPWICATCGYQAVEAQEALSDAWMRENFPEHCPPTPDPPKERP